LRAVVVGPDGALYVSTSNRDGRGKVMDGDDKIIRLDPAIFRK
jgi:quinoprotein glucose dehydrogenase